MSVLRLLCSVVLLGLLFPAVARAQESDPEAVHSLRDDAWALQFSVGPDFTLGSFQGSTISAKHHYAPGRALRYGLTFNGDYRTSLVYRYLMLDRDGNGHHIDLSSGGGRLGVSIYF